MDVGKGQIFIRVAGILCNLLNTFNTFFMYTQRFSASGKWPNCERQSIFYWFAEKGVASYVFSIFGDLQTIFV